MWYVYAQFTEEQRGEVLFHFKNANYFYVVLSVFMSIISHLVRAYRWNFMLQPLGFRPKLLNNFMAVSVAYLMNIFIPKSGEVSRAVVLKKYEEVPFDKGFGTIITERVVDLIFLLLFTMVALLMEFDVLYAYLKEVVPIKTIVLGASVVGILFLSFVLFLKYSKSNMSLKINGLVAGLKEGVFSILKMKKKGGFVFYSLLIWLLYILAFYLGTQALPETSHIAAGTIIITFVVGSFAFAFTNSGFGSYPAAIAGILLVFGIEATVGTALGWIVWTSNIVYILLFGGLSFIFLPIYNRKKIS